MVNQCVNPSCHAEFKLLNTGYVYALESRLTATEFFWLCSDCARTVVPSLDALHQICVTSRSELRSQRPPHPNHDLRLMTQLGAARRWRVQSRAPARRNFMTRHAHPSVEDEAA